MEASWWHVCCVCVDWRYEWVEVWPKYGSLGAMGMTIYTLPGSHLICGGFALTQNCVLIGRVQGPAKDKSTLMTMHETMPVKSRDVDNP